MKKRLFASFLVLCMAVALMPVSVLAEDDVVLDGGESQGICQHSYSSDGAISLDSTGKCRYCDYQCPQTDFATDVDRCTTWRHCTVCPYTETITQHDWTDKSGVCRSCGEERADHSPVVELTADDTLLVFDHESGTFTTADIARYGLYSYKNLADYMSFEEFASYPAQYLAVSIGKGTITPERILEMIELYVRPYRK